MKTSIKQTLHKLEMDDPIALNKQVVEEIALAEQKAFELEMQNVDKYKVFENPQNLSDEEQ